MYGWIACGVTTSSDSCGARFLTLFVASLCVFPVVTHDARVCAPLKQAMSTIYQSSYTAPRPSRSRRVQSSSSSSSSQPRRYNDPDRNYDDPAYPPQPFVSRIAPLSFSSSMAPQGVAYQPVPRAHTYREYGRGVDTANTVGVTVGDSHSGVVSGSQSARFSTTSLDSRRKFEDSNDFVRMGMTGAEAFRFGLRSNDIRPNRPTRQRHITVTSQPAPATHHKDYHRTDPRVSKSLPKSAFHYHVNHTSTMMRHNAQQAASRSPTNPTIIVTQNVYPRASPAVDLSSYGPSPLYRGSLFPVAYNPGHLASSGRAHAFDVSIGAAAPLGPPIYESFPLSNVQQQQDFRTHTQGPIMRFDSKGTRFVMATQPEPTPPSTVDTA